MRNRNFQLIFVFSIIYVLLTSGCEQKIGDQDSTVPTTIFSTSTVTPRHPIATHNSVISSTSDLSIVTEAPRITPSGTAPFYPSTTMTLIPTLYPEQAQETVLDLLKNNAGCELPCFWGLVPGETSWQDAHNFLASFAERIEQRVIDETITDGSEQSTTVIGVYNTIPGYDGLVSSGYQVTNGIIEKISASGSGTELRYQLHQVLDRYGMPDEVLLFLTDVNHGGGPWFSIYVFYEERGIAFFYSAAAQMKGNVLEVCPDGVGPEIGLIVPGSQTLRQMIRDITDGFHIPSINEFPGKNVEFFYESLKEPGSCITFDPAESN